MDKIYKGLIFDNQLSIALLETTEMVNEAIKIHNLSPVCSAALGRTLTIVSYMASGLKNDTDKLSVTVAGDGECGKITVCGNGKLDMRASIVNGQVDLPLKNNGKLDVGKAVGKNGRITVVKSMGLKEPYSGSSELITGEIAEDFTAYYFYSEQQPTAIALGVKIGKDLKCIGAGGVVIQALPNADKENLEKAEEYIKKLNNISTLIEKGEALNTVKEMFNISEFNEYYPKYHCLCSRENVEKMLISLGKKELNSIIKEQGEISVNCEFCNKTYKFSGKDIKEMKF